MLSYGEARYVIGEIGRIGFYQQCVARWQFEVQEYEQQIEMLSMPSSPNGHVSIGEAKGNDVSDFSKKLVEMVAERDDLKAKLYDWIKDLRTANEYLRILMESEDAEYVKAFFETKDKWSLKEVYHISNPYDKMNRIVSQNIKKL